MKLINTIEIDPFDFAQFDYQIPQDGSEEYVEKRFKFWIKCLSDQKLESLNPLYKGSYLVDITSISPEELDIILRQLLVDVDLTQIEDGVTQLLGGIALKIKNHIEIEPTCCGDLGNLMEWENIHLNGSIQWQNLWIGHPWIYYRLVEDKIEFSDYYEKNIDELSDVVVKTEVNFLDFYEKFRMIKIQQLEFRERIQQSLERMNIANGKRISELMTSFE